MLDTLQKMSGITHKVVKDSKSVTQDIEKIWMRTEGKITYNMSAKEFPVISYNDMAFISPQNSIVFRAGDSPVWNRNQTVLPMSWQLFANTIQQPGKKYTLQTIPTLSTAMEFDVRKNQPDFELMLNKRMAQARFSKQARDKYQDAYGYTDFQIMQLDPDIYSDEVMQVVNDLFKQEKAEQEALDNDFDFDDDDVEEPDDIDFVRDVMHEIEDNPEMAQMIAEAQQKQAVMSRKIYAGGNLSKDDLCSVIGGINHGYDADIIKAYTEHRAAMEKDTEHFSTRGGSLCSVDGSQVYIQRLDATTDINNAGNLDKINNYIEEKGSRVFSESSLTEEDLRELGSYEVKDAFYRFLCSLDSWSDIANGRFEQEMTSRMNQN